MSGSNLIFEKNLLLLYSIYDSHGISKSVNPVPD